jgi:ribosomal protein S12 methylthiotransferase accessory factor
MDMKIEFPGGKKVNAIYKDFIIETDQSIDGGGEGTAPEPFDLFLASIGTCAGIYVLNFCQARSIPADGAGLTLAPERDPETGLVSKITIKINLPEGFPEKYEEAVKRAAELCTVKKHLKNPPAFEIRTNVAKPLALATV